MRKGVNALRLKTTCETNEPLGRLRCQMQTRTSPVSRCGDETQCASTLISVQLLAPQQSNPGATFSTAETGARTPRSIQRIGHAPTGIRTQYCSYALAKLQQSQRQTRWWGDAGPGDCRHRRLRDGTLALKRRWQWSCQCNRWHTHTTRDARGIRSAARIRAAADTSQCIVRALKPFAPDYYCMYNKMYNKMY
jgi:hypothetical protein